MERKAESTCCLIQAEQSGPLGNAAMRNNHTTGEYAISNAEAHVASRTGTPAMDHDAFAGFYQRSAPGLLATAAPSVY